ncbi:proton-conducting transporter transmembrane domain-containing protein [Desulfobacula phenolica]|uniref:Hydrogenase-4 component F n=1 Tax=Desulfobacula phenolica TaxID=90732 RepID=A0A1H2G6G3_9BACT|nr:proton-conducting transporter membrane subunit [Desulfobacula phenolica]SDU15174.1 hydrogenase-4 component F [Desulfobacula phenolica]
MVEIVFLTPFITGILAFFLPKRAGRQLLVGTGTIHLFLSLLLWKNRPEAIFKGYFAVTPEGLLSLLVISLLFFLISIYTIGYLKESDILKENIFSGSILLFLSTMTMVTLSDHIMVLWIAIEATTLASAPLIYTHRSSASLEATWKYVLICSVGIAMALLGSVLITLAMDIGNVDVPLSYPALVSVAQKLDPLWLKAGFVFILVGYGTKMGLAPMHTWLPDAHSEAPSPASALLSGVLLNCAYLGIFKTNKIMYAAGLGDFSGMILIVFGLMSILAAATFILKQNEYKRMLAYSSIENMGIIAFGTGVGGLGVYGAVLCMIHHSLIKSSLFLSSGNILLGYKDRLIKNTGDMVRCMPKTFIAFFAGFAGIAGFPPFGIFIGELFIIVAAFRTGHYVAVGIFILSLCVIFAGFANQVMKISFNNFDNDSYDKGDSNKKVCLTEKASLVWPQYILLLTSLILCFFIPDTLYQTIVEAVTAIGGGLK